MSILRWLLYGLISIRQLHCSSWRSRSLVYERRHRGTSWPVAFFVPKNSFHCLVPRSLTRGIRLWAQEQIISTTSGDRFPAKRWLCASYFCGSTSRSPCIICSTAENLPVQNDNVFQPLRLTRISLSLSFQWPRYQFPRRHQQHPLIQPLALPNSFPPFPLEATLPLPRRRPT